MSLVNNSHKIGLWTIGLYIYILNLSEIILCNIALEFTQFTKITPSLPRVNNSQTLFLTLTTPHNCSEYIFFLNSKTVLYDKNVFKFKTQFNIILQVLDLATSRNCIFFASILLRSLSLQNG